jgi:hypothetical protein
MGAVAGKLARVLLTGSGRRAAGLAVSSPHSKNGVSSSPQLESGSEAGARGGVRCSSA